MTEMNKGAVIRAATNEWLLLGYRGVVTAGVGIGVPLALAWIADIKSGNETMRRDFALFQIANVERLARIEGQVGELKGSVEVHRRRLEGLDAETRSIWTRIIDMIHQRPPPTPRP